jgi:UDP-2,3-diacylglucosamine hydrolase
MDRTHRANRVNAGGGDKRAGRKLKIIFVADAHLRGALDPNQAALEGFFLWLETEKNRPDKLILLGDLFDFWTGGCNLLLKHYKPILDALKKLQTKGVEIIYLEGNHDFSMGSFFTKELHAKVFKTSHEINIEGKRTFLAHGDICDDSTGYRLWRWLIRSIFFKITIRLLPDKTILRIAGKLSKGSRRNPLRSRELERRIKNFARNKISKGFDYVILAHTHIPAIKTEVANNTKSSETGPSKAERKGIYANPGSFEGSRKYLQYADGKFRVKTFSNKR